MYLKIIAVGRLGKDPKLTYLDSGDPLTSFGLAVSKKYKKNGQTVEEVTWLNVSIFGKQAESVAQYLKKGQKALVEGTLSPDKSTGRPRIYKGGDGEPGTSYEVRASSVVFLSDKQEESDGEEENAGDPGW